MSRWQAVHLEEGTVHMTSRVSLPQGPFSHWAAEGPANLTSGWLLDSFVPERRDIEWAEQARVSRDHREAWLCFEESFRFYNLQEENCLPRLKAEHLLGHAYPGPTHPQASKTVIWRLGSIYKTRLLSTGKTV